MGARAFPPAYQTETGKKPGGGGAAWATTADSSEAISTIARISLYQFVPPAAVYFKIRSPRCHAALRTTRGAVISLACFRAAGLEWVGVGNVEGLLLRAGHGLEPAGESIMLHSGLVGMTLPALRPSLARLAPGDTLILTTDGIRNDFPRRLVLFDRPQQAAERICGRYAKGTDDALVLVVRYLGP
jgi:hypothetical protein